jgi:integrase
VTTRGKHPPFTIEEQAKAIVEDANVTNKAPERVLTVTDFVERVYFPHMEKFKRASTQKGYRDIWNIHLKPRSGSQWLKDVRTFDVQSWLDSMAKPGKLGRNTLRHIKTFISAVFKLARQQGYYLNENPVRDTAISPKAPQPQETYAYSLDEVQSMLAVLPERAGAVFAVAAFAGLRKSEIQGLLWENYQDGTLRITRAIWQGHVNDPKTERSKGAVPVIKQLAARLDMYRLRCGNPRVLHFAVLDTILKIAHVPEAACPEDRSCLLAFFSHVHFPFSCACFRFRSRAATASLAIRFRSAAERLAFLAAAAFLAISERSVPERLLARAFPPNFPSATAAGFFFCVMRKLSRLPIS